MQYATLEDPNRYYQELPSSNTTDSSQVVQTRPCVPFSANSLDDQSLPNVAHARPVRLACNNGGLQQAQPGRTSSNAQAAAAAPIRLLLVHHHPVLLHNLAYYLAQHTAMDIVGKLIHGDQCVGCVETYRPDVVVMDLPMPGMGVYERLQQLQTPNTGCVRPAVLILTSDLGEYRLCELVDAGARGYLPKDSDGKQLIAAIIALAQGSLYFHGDFGVSLAQRATFAPAAFAAKLASKKAEAKTDSALSQREYQLLALMAEGCSNKEIGRRLFLSTGTIKSYSSRMFDKLCVQGRTQAVVHALNSGLLNPVATRLNTPGVCPSPAMA